LAIEILLTFHFIAQKAPSIADLSPFSGHGQWSIILRAILVKAKKSARSKTISIYLQKYAYQLLGFLACANLTNPHPSRTWDSKKVKPR